MSDPFTGAAGGAIADTIGEMFDIPESHFVEQAEESLTLGGESYETGKLQTQSEGSSNTNALEQDGGVDTALIDLLPF